MFTRGIEEKRKMERIILDKCFNWITESPEKIGERLKMIGEKSNGNKLRKKVKITASSIQQFSALENNRPTSNLGFVSAISITD